MLMNHILYYNNDFTIIINLTHFSKILVRIVIGGSKV